MWVTKEQMRRAKQYDLFSYLQRADPFELKKTSRNEYCLKSHVVIIGRKDLPKGKENFWLLVKMRARIILLRE